MICLFNIGLKWVETHPFEHVGFKILHEFRMDGLPCTNNKAAALKNDTKLENLEGIVITELNIIIDWLKIFKFTQKIEELFFLRRRQHCIGGGAAA